MDKLKSKVKDLNDVDEKYRSLYTKVGDQYELTGIDGINELSAVNSIVSPINTQYEQLKEKFKNVDPEKYRELVQQEEQLRTIQQRIDSEKNALQEQLTTQHTTELDKHTKRIGVLQTALEEALIDQAATVAIAKAAPDRPEAITLLLPHVKAQMKVVEKDGKFSAKIMETKDGKQIERLLTADGKVTDFPLFDEKGGTSLMSEMREKYPSVFPASNKGGGGAAPDTGASGTGLSTGVATGASVQIPRSLAQNNFQEYSRLSAQAKKDGRSIELVEG